MTILDTDTLSIYQHPSNPQSTALRARIALVPTEVEVAATIISYEEQTRGWMTYIAKAQSGQAQIEAYGRLMKHLVNWRNTHVCQYDQQSVE